MGDDIPWIFRGYVLNMARCSEHACVSQCTVESQELGWSTDYPCEKQGFEVFQVNVETRAMCFIDSCVVVFRVINESTTIAGFSEESRQDHVEGNFCKKLFTPVLLCNTVFPLLVLTDYEWRHL